MKLKRHPLLDLFILAGVAPLLLIQSSFAIVFDRAHRPLNPRQAATSAVDWVTLSQSRNAQYNGIGVLGVTDESSSLISLFDFLEDWGCTAFFLDTSPQLDSGLAPAYVLTNGHCYDGGLLPDPNRVISKVVPYTQMLVVLNLFRDVPLSRHQAFRVKEVTYATMGESDLAILKLDATFEQVKGLGIRPIRVRPSPAVPHERVNLVGVPLEGIPRRSRFLHQSSCDVTAITSIRQVEYRWDGVVKHSCSMVGGNSGSPLLSLATQEAVALNNGAIEPSCFPHCAELGADGQPATEATPHASRFNHAVPLWKVPGCFDTRGVFKLDLPTCLLARPTTLEALKE